MLTLKRILAALILWCAADLVATTLLNIAHVIGMENSPSSVPGGIQIAVWLLVSIALAIACVRFSWTRIK